jgi:hypothetical protein
MTKCTGKTQQQSRQHRQARLNRNSDKMYRQDSAAIATEYTDKTDRDRDRQDSNSNPGKIYRQDSTLDRDRDRIYR